MMTFSRSALLEPEDPLQEVAEDDEVEMPWAKPRNPLTSVQVPLSCKDFMLAFARCLCISAEDGMEEVLEKRFKTLPRISLPLNAVI